MLAKEDFSYGFWNYVQSKNGSVITWEKQGREWIKLSYLYAKGGEITASLTKWGKDLVFEIGKKDQITHKLQKIDNDANVACS